MHPTPKGTSIKLSSCPALGARGRPDRWHTAAPWRLQRTDERFMVVFYHSSLNFVLWDIKVFASRLKLLPKPNSLHCSVLFHIWKDALWAQGSTQTASEFRAPFWNISLQSAITNAGKHSITVYTAHNNILWSEAQHWEQESLRFRAILQYKHAKHYNPSGPEQQHLEIMASSQTTALNPSSTKGMPSCHALHTLCAIT